MSASNHSQPDEPEAPVARDSIQANSNRGLVNTGKIENANTGPGQQWNIGENRADGDIIQGYNVTVNKIYQAHPPEDLREAVQAYLTALNEQFRQQKQLVAQTIPLRHKPGQYQPQTEFDPLEDLLGQIGGDQW